MTALRCLQSSEGFRRCVQTALRSPASNHLRLEETNHGFGEGVIVGVPPIAHRRRDAGIGQATFGVWATCRVEADGLLFLGGLCWDQRFRRSLLGLPLRQPDTKTQARLESSSI